MRELDAHIVQLLFYLNVNDWKRVNDQLLSAFPRTLRLIAQDMSSLAADDVPNYLEKHRHLFASQPFLAEFAALELAIYRHPSYGEAIPADVARLTINPTLQTLESNWRGLPEFLVDPANTPTRGEAVILLYRRRTNDSVQVCTPTSMDLLALKIIAEDSDSETIAKQTSRTVGEIDAVVRHAVHKGLLLAPQSTIVRGDSFFQPPFVRHEFLRATTFTLQWHLTQTCDLHCRHCYDRSSRTTLSLPQAIAVLDDLYLFARTHHVDTQISFSGGNPLLYPHFFTLYREAADRGFILAILGNPTSDDILKQLIAIKKPAFFQVSLEGLEEHNDYIRGKGHFQRIFSFLETLRHNRIYSMVMLTLTRANCDQVVPLIEALSGRTDLFTFNRLTMVGEGAELASLELSRLRSLLAQYLETAGSHPNISFKDNFFNLLFAEGQIPLTGGCTGFGCGAAFNFVSLLPDGEVHACRKFPSPIGNIHRDNLVEIYHSNAAKRYRSGPTDCSDCEIRPVCRGCPAVAFGFQQDPLIQRDPYCWKKDRPLPPLMLRY